MENSPRLAFNFPLQGLRGLLAVEIVMFHVYEMGVKKALFPASNWDFVDRFGPYAVYLFFCISGFLITQSLSQKHSVSVFLKIRAIRIYSLFLPLHLLVFCLGPFVGFSWLAALRGHPLQWLTLFFTNLLLLPGMFTGPIAQQNAWSLSYEAVFYLVIAGIYASLTLHRIPRGALATFWCILIAAVCWWRPLSLFIVVGVVVLWLYRKGYKPDFRGAAVLGVAAFIAGPLLSQVTLWGTLLCAAFFFAVVVDGAGVIGKVLSAKVPQWFGKTSYSLYLVHPFVLDPVRRIAVKIATHGHPEAAAIFFWIAGPVCAIGVSAVVYGLIERDLTNWLKRTLVKRKALNQKPSPVVLTMPSIEERPAALGVE